MKYNVNIRGISYDVDADDAYSAAESAVDQYNEDYTSAYDDWLMCCDGSPADDERLEDIKSMSHVDDLSLNLVDSEFQFMPLCDGQRFLFMRFNLHFLFQFMPLCEGQRRSIFNL